MPQNYDLMNLFAVPDYRSPLGRKFTPRKMDCFRQELSQSANAINNHASRNNKDELGAWAMQDIRNRLRILTAPSSRIIARPTACL